MSTVPSRVWLHPALAVAPSPVEGFGLFAAERFSAGSLLWRLGGEVVSRARFEALLRAAEREPDAGYVDAITWDDSRDLVLPPGSPVHYGNHSCDPNAWWTAALTVVARCDIEAGQEVTTDYCTSSDHPDFVLVCACGSQDCRGVVTGDDWRQDALQRRYAGHWIPWIRQRIAAERSGR